MGRQYILQLYDVNHNKIDGLINYKDLKREREINKLDILSFLYPSLYIVGLKEECYIRTKENEYVIKEVNTQDDDWNQYIGKVNIETIQGNPVSHFETVAQTCTDAVNLALTGTGWTIGTCDVTKKRTVKKNNCNSYDVLQEIQTAYNCEMSFDAINKKVNVYQHSGTDKGAYFAEQLNLKKLDVQSNSYDYVTRLIPIGKDNLGIATVNNNKNYVENYQYTNKVITAYWEDNRYTLAQDLYEDAMERLAYLSIPLKAYSADILDLAKANEEYSILDYSLGDTITLLSKSRKVKEKQRIIKITEYPLEPEKNTVEIANKIASLDVLNVRFSNTSDTVDTVTTSDGYLDGKKIDAVDWDRIQHIHVQTADIEDASITTAKIGTAQITQALIANAAIGTAQIQTAAINTAHIQLASITNALIAAAAIGTAQIQTAAITQALIANSAVGTSQIADLAVGNAKISDLDVAKLNAGTIDTTKISIAGANSRLVIRGNRLQVFATKADNSLYERVSLGDVNGDGSIYGFRVRGADGTTVLLDENGVKREGITDGSINNAKIAGDANISGTKLDINSVVTAINGGTTTISGSKVLLNGQTLDVQFNTITDNINNIEIGGRNLLYNSGNYKDTNNWIIPSNVFSNKINADNTLTITKIADISASHAGVSLVSKLVVGQQYTVTICLKSSISCNIGLNLEDYNSNFIRNFNCNLQNADTYYVITKTFTAATLDANVIKLSITSSEFLLNQLVTFKYLKLEQGNKSTDWTPAVEDIQTQIDSQTAQISANAKAITFKLDSQTFTKYTITNDKNITNINTHLGEATTAIGTLQGQILLKVSQEDINTSISKMDIGVRNLIFNSVGDLLPNGWTSGVMQDIVDNKKALKIVTATVNELQKASARFKVEPNTTYTVSCWVKTSENCKGYDVFFLSRKVGSAADFDYINLPITGSAKYALTYVTGTFTTKSDETEGYIRLDNNGSTDGNDASVWFALLKMIKGNKTSKDWTPAPEDTQSQIDSATTRISTSEGSIKVLKNAIDLKVSTSDFTSGYINLVSDGSFENDGIGWGVGGTIITDGHLGSKSLKFISKDGKALNRPITVIPGNKYRICYWYKTSADNNGTADNQKLRIGKWNDGTLLVGLGTDGVSTAWTQRTVDWVVPSGITSILLGVGTNLTTGSIQFDDISFLDITLETRVKDAELKIRDDSIISTVRSSYLYQNDLNGKTSASDVKSIIQQNSDSIMIGFNNINAKIQITQDSLDIRDYNGKNAISFEDRQMKLFDYDTTQYLGYFGVSTWGSTNNKGLCINMDEGSFIAFGKNNGTSYITDLAMNYGAVADSPRGLNLFADLHCATNVGLSWASNTDKASIYFTNVDSSKSELRLEIGDDAEDEVCIISKLYTSSAGNNIMKFGGNGINAYTTLNMNGYEIKNTSIASINNPSGSGTAIDVWTSLNLHNWEINNVQIKANSIQCYGSKNRIVKTDSFGTRALNAVESAECLFIDSGSNKLVNGKCIIPIESIFAQTISAYVGYDVVLTKYGEGDIFVSERNQNYFVIEAIKDTKDIEFGWILIAKQKGYENTRLEEVAP